MRLGKSRPIVELACFLHEAGLIDLVILCVPAQVKDVWIHPELGEVKKHAFVETICKEFNSNNSDILDIVLGDSADKRLQFVVLSHEILRQEDARGDFPRAYQIRKLANGKKAWIVFDEASAFGSYKSLQTKSALQLRKLVLPSRLTTLDGTPIGNSPIEQYSKFKVLGEDILGYDNFYHFRAAHQITTPNTFAKRGKAYVGFKNQERIDAKVKSFCEYLEQKDCLDMPELVPSFFTVALTEKSWRRYCEMRDEMVAELEDGREATALYASTKVMRLAQLCSGFIGGVEHEVTQELETVEVSTETVDAVIQWLKRRLIEEPNFKCVIWCRFRPEIERLYQRIIKDTKANPRMIYGAKKIYNDELHRDNSYVGSLVLVAQPQAVRYGVDYSKADTELFMSQNYDAIVRRQAEQRLQPGEGVRKSTLVIDLLVTGPQGQKTVTWDIKDSLANKQSVAQRTTEQWKKILLET